MEDECLVHILGRLSSGQLHLVYSGQVRDVPDGFLQVSLGNLVQLGIFSPWGVSFTLAS